MLKNLALMVSCLMVVNDSGTASEPFEEGLISLPPRSIPAHLYEQYTLGNQVPVYDWYIDGTLGNQPIIFKNEEILQLTDRARQRQSGYYGETDQYLYSMLDKYGSSIKGKRIAIIGSLTPWYETIVIVYGGQPTTIEYNKIINEDSRIQVMTVEEYDRNPQKFDSVISISSIEHDGLGRYGDPINPQGDFGAMAKMKNMLNDEGMLFLSVPVGQDAIYWNAHRQYGALRLPLLFKGWEMIDSAGFLPDDFYVEGYRGHQPVFVLKPCKERR